MKTFTYALIAATITAGMASPALAGGEEHFVDTQVVEIAADQLVLSNGMKLDQNIEYFAMPNAAAGDKVRVIFTDNNELKQVRVIR